MTKEAAERLLDAINQSEKEARNARRKNKGYNTGQLKRIGN